MKEILVHEMPECDLCIHFKVVIQTAAFDGATRMGPWAYMCESHFAEFGIGLGTGVGQKLVLREI